MIDEDGNGPMDQEYWRQKYEDYKICFNREIRFENGTRIELRLWNENRTLTDGEVCELLETMQEASKLLGYKVL